MLHKQTIFIVAIIFIVVFALLWIPACFFITGQQIKRMQVHLLCETDHQSLLEACRDLSKKVAIGDLKPGKYQVRHLRAHPDVSRFPKSIIDLVPSYVFIDNDGRVMVEMLGGLGHFGVNAFPEDYKEPFPGFKYHDIELIDGLWYYDDELREENQKYQKKIKSLIQRRE